MTSVALGLGSYLLLALFQSPAATPDPVSCDERIFDRPHALSLEGREVKRFRQILEIGRRSQGVTVDALTLIRHFLACIDEVRAVAGAAEAPAWNSVAGLRGRLIGSGAVEFSVAGEQRSFSIGPKAQPWKMARRIQRWLERGVSGSVEDREHRRDALWTLLVESYLSFLDDRYHHFDYADVVKLDEARSRGRSFVPGFIPRFQGERLFIEDTLAEDLDATGVAAGWEVIEWNGKAFSGVESEALFSWWLRAQPFDYSFKATSQGKTVSYRGRSIPYRMRNMNWTVRGRIAYLRLRYFSEDTIIKFRRIARRLEATGAESLIVDVRGNPGGPVAFDFLDCFFKPGQVIASYRRQGAERMEHVEGTVEYYDYPLVVLIDRDSASMSEVFAAAVRQWGVGTLVGETTTGKGVGQTAYSVAGEGRLFLVETSYYYPGTEETWHGQGVPADVVVTLEEAARRRVVESLDEPVIDLETRMEIDPVLEEAFRILERSP